MKDRLTAVLKVFEDGGKDPFTIIGKDRRLKRFPRHFDQMNDVGVF